MSMLFLMFFAAGCGPLPDELMQQLQGGYEAEPMPAWQPRVAIVVLGEGVQRNFNLTEGRYECPHQD